MNVLSPLSAAVLAGGKSTRMGTDKALLPLVEGGRPLLAIVLERIAEVANDVAIVGGDPERYGGFGVRWVPDRFAGAAALGGIATAIAAAKHDHCLVVACDMPFLNVPLLRAIAAAPRDYDVLVPAVPGRSRQAQDGLVYQTLHAIYGRGCLPAIEDRIGAGRLQVVGFFADVRVSTLPVEEVRRWDPELRSFFNANSPETLREARAMLSEREPPVVGGR